MRTLWEPKKTKGNDQGLMKIGELARLLGVTPRTIRYYESLGLIQPSGRTEGGFRLYSRADASLLLSIFSFKEMGLSLEEIKKFADQARKKRRAFDAFRDILGGLEFCEKEIVKKMENLEHTLSEIRRAKQLLEDCPGCDDKEFDQECVECWKGKGDIPKPLLMLVQMVAKSNQNRGNQSGNGAKALSTEKQEKDEAPRSFQDY